VNFLSLDTSTKYSAVAIGCGDKLLYSKRLALDKSRLTSLQDMIKDGLKKSKISLGELDCFGVGIGPGSFTGLRIGLSAIKALSYAQNKPCVVFSSLDAIAFNQYKNPPDNLCVLVDARRSSVYASFYKKDSGFLKKVSADLLLNKDAVLNKLDSSIYCCGDGFGVYGNEFKKKVKSGNILKEVFWYPTPSSLSILTQLNFKGKKIIDSFGLNAAYLYEEDCQVVKQINGRT
jgi:tRNA threonylcarbamoyladenosine biosynthesis protein TsaB